MWLENLLENKANHDQYGDNFGLALGISSNTANQHGETF